MVWVKLSDDVPQRKEHRRLSGAANWMLFCLVAYSNRSLTDGLFEEDDLEVAWPGQSVDQRHQALEELLHAGAVVRVPNGFRVVLLMEDQPSADEIRERRAADRERQRKHRASRRDSAGESRPPARSRSRPSSPSSPNQTGPAPAASVEDFRNEGQK